EENIITAHPKSELSYLSNDPLPRIQMVFRKTKGELRSPEEVDLASFISVKGIKAKGNQLTTETLNKIDPLESLPDSEAPAIEVDNVPEVTPIVEVEASPESTTAVNEVVDNLNDMDKPVMPSKSDSDEPKSDKNGSYDADDQAPQITLDF
ncbi:MAG: hypothetical protein L7S65_03145, partial [Schleiferiaceae bacterium]|nr:hypothetical protein [Schleiferiaceae bacterium]